MNFEIEPGDWCKIAFEEVADLSGALIFVVVPAEEGTDHDLVARSHTVMWRDEDNSREAQRACLELARVACHLGPAASLTLQRYYQEIWIPKLGRTRG